MKVIKSFICGLYSLVANIILFLVCTAIFAFLITYIDDLLQQIFIFFVYFCSIAMLIFAFYIIKNRWIKYVYFTDKLIYERINSRNKREIKYDEVVDFGVVKFLKYERFIYISKRLLSDDEKRFIIAQNNPKIDDVIIVHYSNSTYEFVQKRLNSK